MNKFAKSSLPVHMGPRKNLLSKKSVKNLVTLSLFLSNLTWSELGIQVESHKPWLAVTLQKDNVKKAPWKIREVIKSGKLGWYRSQYARKCTGWFSKFVVGKWIKTDLILVIFRLVNDGRLWSSWTDKASAFLPSVINEACCQFISQLVNKQLEQMQW